MFSEILLEILTERCYTEDVCRREDDIKVDVKEIGWEGVDCIHGPGEGWAVSSAEHGKHTLEHHWVVSSAEHGKQTREHHKMSGIS